MDYFVPDTFKKAENLKKNPNRKYIYFAGGTILNWKGSPKADGLIDLKNLNLRQIKVTKSKVIIGAMATISETADNKKLPEAIVKAATYFTSRNIRNMATAGGTATGNFFISNLLPVFLAFKADIEFFHKGKKRILPLNDWLKNKPGLICSIIVTRPDRKVKVKQEKIAAIDFPLIVTAIGFEIERNIITDPVLAISGATSKTVCLYSAGEYLAGKQIKNIDYTELNELIQKEIKPVKNIKASPHLKRKFIENHIKSIVSEFKNEHKI